MPGALAVLVVVVALARRRAPAHARGHDLLKYARLSTLAGAFVFAALALVPLVAGPVALRAGALTATISAPHKPLSIAVLGW